MVEFKSRRVVDCFHSKSLLPYSVVVEARMKGEDLCNMYMCDTIMTWLEQVQSSYKFSEGEEVCHKENIGLKMEVVSIKKEYYSFKNASGVVEQRVRMRGIDCAWWV